MTRTILRSLFDRLGNTAAKWAACLLAVACASGAWGALTGSGTEDNPYLIQSLTDLKDFRDSVNGGKNYTGEYVKLMADIDLNNEQWTPIGSSADSTTATFAGHFDGNNKTISNLYISEVAETYHGTGFIGALGYSGNKDVSLKNLKIVNADVDGISAGNPTINGIAVAVGGMPYGGTIENVSVENATVHGNRYVAGIVGFVSGTVKSCSVKNVTIVATPDKLSGSYDNGDKAGGICGYTNSHVANVIENNTLSGSIDITAHRDVGGIIGMTQNNTTVAGNTLADTAALSIIVDKVTGSNSSSVNAGWLIGRNADAASSGTDGVSVAEANTISSSATTATTTIKDPVAQIGSENYGTLAAAVYAAEEDDTITVVADPATLTAPEGYVFNTVNDVTTLIKVVAQIGSTKYETLAEAVAAVPADGTETTIQMIANEELSGAVTIPAEKNVVLDLNGKTVSGAVNTAKNCALVENSGTLKIVDSSSGGQIVNTATGTTSDKWHGISNAGTLVIEGGAFSTACAGGYVVRTVTGGTTTVDSISVKGGAMKGVFQTAGGTLIVNDADIDVSCDYYVFDVRGDGGTPATGGSVTVNGGSFELTHTNGQQMLNFAMDEGGDNTLTINGGDFTFVNTTYATKELLVFNDITSAVGTYAFKIAGGTFKGPSENWNLLWLHSQTVETFVAKGGSAVISGGNFYTNPENETNEYNWTVRGVKLAPDCKYSDALVDEDNATYYTIVSLGVAKIERDGQEPQYFPTLAAANNAAVAGDVITILQSTSEMLPRTKVADVTYTAAEGVVLSGGVDTNWWQYDVTLDGLSFTGKGVSISADQTAKPSVTIRNCTFTECTANAKKEGALSVKGGPSSVTVENCTITDVQPNTTLAAADQPVTLGMYIIGGEVSIVDNTVSGVGQSAIYVQTGEALTVTDNVISDWGTSGKGRAIRLDVKETAEPVVVTRNAMFDPDPATTEAYVQIARMPETGNVDVSANYWGGADPFSTTANGTSLLSTDNGIAPAVLAAAATTYYAEHTAEEGLGDLRGFVAAVIGSDGTLTGCYASLADAVAAAEAGDTVTLIADISDLSTVTVNAGQNVTLDLNGHTIEAGLKQAGRHYYAIDNYGTFTLKDSSESQTGKIRARGIENLGNGVMIVDGGIIEAIDTNGGAAIWNEGTLTMNGGVLRATHVGSSSDTYGPGALNNQGTAMITKADIQSANKRTYAIISSGAITINPAKDDDVIVAGAHGGLAVDSGTATVTGGRFSSTEYYGLYVSNDGTGTAAKAQVTVSGGEFTGNTQSVHIGSDVNTPVDSVIEISGGTFHGTIFAENKVTEDGGISVSGGSFENPVPEAYCADGYIPNAEQDSETGLYTVKTGSYVAQIGSTKYETLAEALGAAQTGDTVTLIADAVLPSQFIFNAEKEITLDLAGHAITSTADDLLRVESGALTVNDSVGGGSVFTDNWTVFCVAGGEVVVNGGKFSATQHNTVYVSKGSITFNGGMVDMGVDSVGEYSGEDVQAYEGLGENAGYTIFAEPLVSDIDPPIYETTAVGVSSTVKLDAYYGPGATLTWSSSDTSIATVDSTGLVTFTGTAGTATIYAVAQNGSYATAMVAVGTATVKNMTTGTEYVMLQTAIDAASACDTLKLIANVSLTDAAYVPDTAEIVIDLDGHDIVNTRTGVTSAQYAIYNDGTLTIMDSKDDGTTGGHVYTANIETSGNEAVLNYGTLVIEGGWFGDSDCNKTNANVINAGRAVTTYGTATLNGGHYTAIDNFTNGKYTYALYSNGSAASLTINAADIYGTMNGVISSYNGGLLTVNDATIVFGRMDFDTYPYRLAYGYYGNIVINGGTWKTQAKVRADDSQEFCDWYKSDAITITGGKFDLQDWNDVYGIAKISGGIFNKVVPAKNLATGCICTDNLDPETNVTYPYTVFKPIAQVGDVKYGTFEDAIAAAEALEPVPAIVVLDTTAEVPDGWKFVTENDVTTLVRKVYVAQIGTTKYESLAEAYSNAASGDTIEMIADDRLSSELIIGRSVTITGAVDSEGKPLYTIYGKPTDNYNVDVFIKNASSAIDVTIQNVNISEFGHKYSTSTGNGALYVSRSTHVDTHVLVSNVTFSAYNNYAIIAPQGRVEVVDCAIDGYKDPSYGALCTGGVWSGDMFDEVPSSTMSVKRTVIINLDSNMSGTTAYAIDMRAGATATVVDCTITNVRDGIAAVAAQESGTGATSVTVSGTTVEAARNALAISGNPKYLGGSVIAELAVSSGTYIGAVVLPEQYEDYGIIEISGGYFSQYIVEDFCASGYLCTTRPVKDELYQVVPAATVTYTLVGGDPEGAALPSPASLAYPSGDMAEIALAPATCTDGGYTFAGWKVSGEGDAVAVLPAGTTGDITLVATWTGVKTVKVTDAEVDIKVTDEWLEANSLDTADTTTIQQALNKEEANGNKAWENYVLGLDGSDPNAKLAADAAQGPVSATPITSNVDVPPVDTGFTVEYKLVSVDTNGTTVTQSALQSTPDLTADIAAMTSETNVVYYKTVAVITSTTDSNVTVEVPSTNTIGVLKVASAPKTAMIAVPWAALDGDGAISAANLVRTANLTVGDELHYYTNGKFQSWTLGANGTWQSTKNVSDSGTTDGDAASDAKIPRGSAVWLKRQDASKPVYLVGEVGTGTAKTALEGGTENGPAWNMVASPSVEELDISEKFSSPNENDRIVVPTDGAPKNYTYQNGAWGYSTTEPVIINGVQVGVRPIRKTGDAKVPAGTGFWYLNSGVAKEVDWTSAEEGGAEEEGD